MHLGRIKATSSNIRLSSSGGRVDGRSKDIFEALFEATDDVVKVARLTRPGRLTKN
jgi:hypothetical protein